MTDPNTDPRENAQLSEGADSPSPEQIEPQPQDILADRENADSKRGRPSHDSDPGHI